MLRLWAMTRRRIVSTVERPIIPPECSWKQYSHARLQFRVTWIWGTTGSCFSHSGPYGCMRERVSIMGIKRNVRHWPYSKVLESLTPGDLRDQNTERLKVISKPNFDVNLNHPGGVNHINN